MLMGDFGVDVYDYRAARLRRSKRRKGGANPQVGGGGVIGGGFCATILGGLGFLLVVPITGGIP